MKIEINFDDIFVEEEGEYSLQELVKSEIVYKLKQEMWSRIGETTKEAVNKEVLEYLKIEKEQYLKSIIETAFKENVYKFKNEETTPEKYVNNLMNDYLLNPSNNFNKEVKSHIEKESVTIAKDLKDRYDQVFASQIILKLKETGLLK